MFPDGVGSFSASPYTLPLRGALGTYRYVSLTGNDANDGLSWATAKATIQAGIDSASAGDTVWVENGGYTLSTTIALDKSIAVRGTSGNPADVVVNGNGAVRCFTISATNAALCNVTITNGFTESRGGGVALVAAATVDGCVMVDNKLSGSDGAGCYVMNNGVVRNCQILNNTANGKGTGIQLDGGSLLRSTVGYNTGSGPGVYMDSASSLWDSRIVGNVASGKNHGGGVAGGAIVDGCTIVSNSITYSGYHGGGVADSAIIRNCLIQGNKATASNGGGGGILTRDGKRVVNCLVIGNTSGGDGGGVYAAGEATVENCTIVGNKGKAKGGLNFTSAGTIRNTIVWGNSPINDTLPSVVEASCMDVTALPSGNGNRSDNPGFAAPGSGTGATFVPGDYRLQKTSPLRNAGFNRPGMAGQIDLAGNSRISEETVDIGAYEFTVMRPAATMLFLR